MNSKQIQAYYNIQCIITPDQKGSSFGICQACRRELNNWIDTDQQTVRIDLNFKPRSVVYFMYDRNLRRKTRRRNRGEIDFHNRALLIIREIFVGNEFKWRVSAAEHWMDHNIVFFHIVFYFNFCFFVVVSTSLFTVNLVLL